MGTPGTDTKGARESTERMIARASGKRVSTQWPEWRCRNCGRTYPVDTPFVKCPKDNAPLVRWKEYEVKT